MIDDADRVLETVLGAKVTTLSLATHKSELLALRGHGVTVGATDPPDDDEDPMAQAAADDERTRATVDIRQVLADAIEPHGFKLGEELRPFVRLQSATPTTDLSFFFLLDNYVPPFAVVPLSQTKTTVVVHTRNDLTDADNIFFEGLGVEAIRLRGLPTLSPTYLQSLRDRVGAAREARAEAAPATVEITSRRELVRKVDPARVAEYASTEQDDLFEAATVRILSPLVDHLVALGSGFRGAAVPDGLLVRDRTTDGSCELAHYDCKSKKADWYGLDPQDGDQQIRYLAIQRRLERSEAWRPRGIVLFTPEVSGEVLAEKLQKDIWRRALENGLKLRVVPARVLKRWHDLQAQERTGSLRSIINTRAFWGAFFDLTLPGVSDVQQGELLPHRDAGARLVSIADAEVMWLAAITDHSRVLAAAGRSLQEADESVEIHDKVRRPNIVQQFHRLNSERSHTVAGLAVALGLTQEGVRYLLLNRVFDPSSDYEFGDHGQTHLRALWTEVGRPSRRG